MQQNLRVLVVAICLISSSYCACPDGFVEPGSGLSLDSSIECIQCEFGCKDCDNDATTCNDLFDWVDGADIVSGTITNYCNAPHAYNKETELCELCQTGCSMCLIDHDACILCKTGWDFYEGDYSCTRATLGLTATNFVLSVLALAASVLTCLKASKLQ